MPTIASIDGVLRRIYLDPAAAAGGVLSFHAVEDIYQEYRARRRTDETLRGFAPLIRAEGNVAKGGGKFTPRYIVLLDGAKLVIPVGPDTINVSGEVLTDDQTAPFATDLLTDPVVINYAPPEAEVIQVAVGSGLSPSQDALLTRLLDLAEADEELTETAATLRKRGTATVLLEKTVAGGSITPVALTDA